MTQEDNPSLYKINREIGEIKTEMKVMNKNLSAVVQNHGERINTLEDSSSTMQGRATGAGFLAGIIGTIISIAAFFRNLSK